MVLWDWVRLGSLLQVDLVGLGWAGEAEVKNLSGGERRRVALARLVLERPQASRGSAALKSASDP